MVTGFNSVSQRSLFSSFIRKSFHLKGSTCNSGFEKHHLTGYGMTVGKWLSAGVSLGLSSRPISYELCDS